MSTTTTKRNIFQWSSEDFCTTLNFTTNVPISTSLRYTENNPLCYVNRIYLANENSYNCYKQTLQWLLFCELYNTSDGKLKICLKIRSVQLSIPELTFLEAHIDLNLKGKVSVQMKKYFTKSISRKKANLSLFHHECSDYKRDDYTMKIYCKMEVNGICEFKPLRITNANAFLHSERFPESNPKNVWNGINSVVSPYHIQCYEKLLVDDKFADLILRVDSKEIKAHKCILANYSPVFASMITNTPNLTEIEISDIRVDVIRVLLYFMYTGTIKNINNTQLAVDVSVASKKYGIKGVKEKCEQFIDSHEINADNAISYLLSADSMDFESLRNYIINIIVNNLNSYSTSDFQKLNQQNPNLMIK